MISRKRTPGEFMAKHVILTLDLYTEVSWEQRGALYAALEREGWAQVDRLTTLWRTTYADDRDAPELLDEARHDVASCTSSCGIADFEAGLAVSG
jgi:hypothetical protein